MPVETVVSPGASGEKMRRDPIFPETLSQIPKIQKPGYARAPLLSFLLLLSLFLIFHFLIYFYKILIILY